MRFTILPSSALILILTFLLAWLAGSSEFPLSKIWLLTSEGLTDEDRELLSTVFLSIRLPRLLVAALCGGALSAAGVLSQGLFRNPLASPSVLGATAGGVLGAVVVFYCVNPWLHWFWLPSGAFLATLLTMGLVLVIFRSLGAAESSQLLICGFAITTLLGAFTSLLISLMLPQIEKTASLLQWMMGAFNGRGWGHLLMALPAVLAGLALAFSLARKLDLLAFGDDLASSLNIAIPKLQHQSIVAIALLVGASVAVAGALPFVGLIVPHITRKFTGPLHHLLLPVSILHGMILLIIADLFAQKLLFPRELEVGTLTSVLGVIFFFIILNRRDYAPS